MLVSLALVLGAGVMALVLLASNAPNALAVGALLAALPVGPVIACFLWLDRYEPEPAGLLFTAFLWGALAATAAALLLQTLGAGKGQAQVSSDLNMDQVSSDSVKYDPSSSSRTGKPPSGFFLRNSGDRVCPLIRSTGSIGTWRPFSAK